MSKHTPGPWTVEEGDGTCLFIATCEDGQPVATIDCGREILAVDEANAALIASAPDLLEACKLALFEGNIVRNVAGEDFNRAMIRIETAIAKAEAEE